MANITQGDDETHQELYILYKLSDSALSVLLYFTLGKVSPKYAKYTIYIYIYIHYNS